MKHTCHPFVLTALFMGLVLLTGCQKRETAAVSTDASADQTRKEADMARERAAIEEERRQAALDKAEAQRLRDESEDLRAEAELRQSISKLDGDSSLESSPAIASPVESEQKSFTAKYTVPDTVSYQSFYDDLAPDGKWMDSGDYGYVWQPDVSSQEDWAPYTDGSWSYTDYGWAWDSQESFGSICYHYGRWTRLRSIGWVWVPDHVWAPAWVSWRTGDDCVGWAPLPPAARWHGNLGIHGWVDGTCHIPPTSYCFVNNREFFHQRCREVLLPRRECEDRFLKSRNVTALTEVRKPGGAAFIRCDGPPVDKLREHHKGDWHERSISFQNDSRGGAGPRQDQTGNALAMRQWSLKHGPDDRETRPKKVLREIPGDQDVRPESEVKNPREFKRVVAAEAGSALKQVLPPREDRGPSKGNDSAIPPREKINRTSDPSVARTAPSDPALSQRPVADQNRKTRDPNATPSAPPGNPQQPPLVVEQRGTPVPSSVQAPDNSRPDARQDLAADNARRLQEKKQLEDRENAELARLNALKKAQQQEASRSAENESRHQREMAAQRQQADLEKQTALNAARQKQDEDAVRLREAETQRQKQSTPSSQKDSRDAQQMEAAKQQEASRAAEIARQQESARVLKQQEDAQRTAATRQKEEVARAAEIARQQEVLKARKQQEDAQRSATLVEKQGEAQRAAAMREQQEAARRAAAMREQQESLRSAEIAVQQEAAKARKQQEAAQQAAVMREKQEAARAAEVARQQEMAQARKQQEDAQRANAAREQQESARAAQAARQQEMAQARKQQEDAQRANTERQKQEAERARAEDAKKKDKNNR